MSFHILAVAAILCLAAASCSSPENIPAGTSGSITTADTARPPQETPQAPAANSRIIPGKSIGDVYIHESMDSVTARLGRPQTGDAAMGKAVSIWLSDTAKGTPHFLSIYSRAGFGAANEQQRVVNIRASSPFFKTAEGLGAGVSLSAIKRQYPTLRPVAAYADTLHSNTAITIYDAEATGISFEVNTDSTCVAVGVHGSNTLITATYLPLFHGLKQR